MAGLFKDFCEKLFSIHGLSPVSYPGGHLEEEY
jgi:hypothetical protein